MILAFLPWLDTSQVRSARYRPLLPAVLLGVRRRSASGSAGSARSRRKAAMSSPRASSRSTTSLHFLVILPLLGLVETAKPLPNSIAESVLQEGVPIGASAPPPSADVQSVDRTMSMTVAARSRARSRRLAACGVGRRCRWRTDDAETPPRAEVVVRRPVRQIRPRAAAARLQGLPRGLRGLPRLELVAFRNLAEPGGPGFTAAQAAAVAAEYKVQDGPNDAGRDVERDGARRPTVSRRRSRTRMPARARQGGACRPTCR